MNIGFDKHKARAQINSMLRRRILASRRETLYKMLSKKHDGKVPCFVCGGHVPKSIATLEHIKPLSKGGTDEMNNLSISHFACNQRRGNNEEEVNQ